MISASSAFTTANAILRKQPIYLIEIAGYSRAFTNYVTGVSGQVDWLESIDENDTTVDDLDGGANLGDFTFNVQDRNNLITADFPSFVFEGKTVTCKSGFPGMLQSDFALLFTGKIDSVASDNKNTEYKFTCVDNKDILSKVIYTEADDGFATDSDHKRTLNDHPLTILAAIIENELGLTRTDYNANKLLMYRDGLFAGIQFYFEIDSPPAAKDFIENELMKPLGGYIWVNNKGQIDFNFFRRDSRLIVTGGCLLAAWTDSAGVIVGSPFAVSISLGMTLTLVAPAGATKLSFGINDDHFVDNVGGWNLLVNGTAVAVSSLARPWNVSGINANYQFNATSSTTPATISVTAGTTYNISYTGGTASLGPGWAFVDPAGNPGVGSALDGPGIYAVGLPLGSITDPQFAFTNDNMQEIPEATQADLINTVSFRFDKDDQGNFTAESVREYTKSVALYGQFGQQVIEASGLRSGLQAYSLAATTSQMIFLRYGLKNLQFEELTAHWTAALLEPGDLVSVTSDKVPDRIAGVMGITNKLFEVLDRKWDFDRCVVTVKLLDASYLLALGQYLIAPDGVANFTSATAYQKGRYMFLSNNSDQYSDATAGHPLG